MLDWLLAHWKDILAGYGALVSLCSIIVELTPTQKDDNVWAKVVRVLNFFSTVFTKEDAAKIAAGSKK